MIRASEKAVPGGWGGFLCRKRYIDDKVTVAIGEMSSVVILGAGFDTLAYRLPTLADIPVWEVDQPVNIKAKEARLRRLFGEVPAHVKLVAIDFDHEDLGSVLSSHGFSSGNQTFFVWEAVTQSIPDRNRHPGDLRFPGQGTVWQPPGVHVCAQGLNRWKRVSWS
jgi:methyltransferase (TIGR00027 family)